MPSKSKDEKPFLLSNTLHDLALLRVSDVDIAADMNPSTAPSLLTVNVQENMPSQEHLLSRSYEFVREARSAIKVHHSAAVSSQGGRVEDVREELEKVLEDLPV